MLVGPDVGPQDFMQCILGPDLVIANLFVSLVAGMTDFKISLAR